MSRIEFTDTPFIANNDGVIVEIPTHEWECIRQNTAVRNVYLDWTDEEILSESTKKIEDIYNEYNKTGIQSPVSLMRYGQFSRRTKEEIIQQEVAEITKKRDFERYIAGCVKKYLEGDGNE